MSDSISIINANTHNLNNISLSLPKNSLIVITGVSGSGKSSLAFDTLYAEGQRKYVESLSVYFRQFLTQIKKPDVEKIEGIMPAISVEQRGLSHNPRSTVGTVTEIHDYLRLLYARVGEVYCPTHNIALSSFTVSEIVGEILSFTGEKIYIIIVMDNVTTDNYNKIMNKLEAEMFNKIRVNGEIYDIDLHPVFDEINDFAVILDRFTVKDKIKAKVTDSVEQALKYGNNTMHILRNNKIIKYSINLFCPHCNYTVSHFEPNNFSFNSPNGFCTKCNGIGKTHTFDIKKNY